MFLYDLNHGTCAITSIDDLGDMILMGVIQNYVQFSKIPACILFLLNSLYAFAYLFILNSGILYN